MLECVVDCCTRASDGLETEGRLDEQYIAKQLHIAWGKMLDALVLDLDPTADIDCSEKAYQGVKQFLRSDRDPFLPPAHQATGERRGA